jgi:ZIP family zinc transporter
MFDDNFPYGHPRFLGAVCRHFAAGVVAAATATAAGAILAMSADTMIPEAFEYTHGFAGLIR